MQTLTRETKGLDLVRRDWCTLSREAGSKVLDFILSGKPREEIVSDIQAFLREIASKIKNNALGIEQYVVTKALTKAPGDYPDAKNQPHVQVAKAMMEQGTPIGAGTVVEYVICVDTGKAGVADRCPRESSRRSARLSSFSSSLHARRARDGDDVDHDDDHLFLFAPLPSLCSRPHLCLAIA